MSVAPIEQFSGVGNYGRDFDADEFVSIENEEWMVTNRRRANLSQVDSSGIYNSRDYCRLINFEAYA